MSRILAWVLPGSRQISRGRRLEGVSAVLLWMGFLALAVARFEDLTVALSGGLRERIALLTLLVVPAGLWAWARWDERRYSGDGDKETHLPHPPGLGWSVFRQSPMAVLGLWIVVLFCLAALLAPFLARHAPGEMILLPGVSDQDPFTAAPPLTPGFVLGTDHLSRDLFSRILYGAGVSLFIGLVAVLVSVTLGTLLGSIAGYLGGRVDSLLMRLVDLFMAFPRIVLLVAVVGILGRSMVLVILALALTQWPFPARIVRGEILALREREFAEAARALGFSGTRILFRHLLPNAMAPIIVAASLGVGNTILLEAGLSFLNLGVQSPDVSWGTMIADGRDHLFDAWWIATFPGLAIVAVVLGFNLLGDGLRNAMDPRQTGGSQP